MSMNGPERCVWSIVRSLLAIVAAIVFLWSATPSASAAVTLSRVAPYDGEILDRAPRGVSLAFTEEFDPASLTVTLVDVNGTPVPGTALAAPSDQLNASLNLPPNLPFGTYSVIWNGKAKADGSTFQGYSSFSIGNREDASIVTIPSTQGDREGPPAWMQTGGRWLALLGVVALGALWPIWTTIVRPAAGGQRDRAPYLMTGMQRFVIAAIALALVGSLIDLIIASQGRADGTPIDKLMNTIGNDDVGFWWMIRVAMIGLIGLVLSRVNWWAPRKSIILSTLAWVLSIVMPVTLSFTSHAVDDRAGRAAAIAMDAVHLVSTMLWGGGALLLGGVVIHRLLDRTAPVHHPPIVSIWKRFGGLTILTWGVMILSGLHLADLFAGNMNAVQNTTYGNALGVKMLLAFLAIVASIAGALALWRLAKRGGSPQTLRWPFIAQAALVGLLLLPAAQMSTHPTARDVIIETTKQKAVQVDMPGRDTLLLIAPARVGVNHLRVEFDGPFLSNDTELHASITNRSHPELGTKRIQLSRVTGNAFEHHGTDFAVIGDWDITLSMKQQTNETSATTINQRMDTHADTGPLPAAAWRFSTLGGVTGLVLAVIGLAGIATAVMTGRGPLRKEAGGLGVAALALAAIILVQARIDPALAVTDEQGAINPNDMAMVKRGETLYQANCASCHGSNLRGDGPLAKNLNPPPSDFAAPHTFVHSDSDFVFWIKNGKQGTAMPGFSVTLDDQGVRDVIAYVQNWQANYDGSNNTAVSATSCTVAPMEYTELPEIFHHGVMPDIRRGTDLVRSIDPAVGGDTSNQVMYTVEQMVACANSGQTLSQLRLYSPMLLQEIFPTGLNQDLTTAATTRATPIAADKQITIQDVQSVSQLADGRVAVSLTFRDPAGVGVVPGARPITQATLVLVKDANGNWIVDEIR